MKEYISPQVEVVIFTLTEVLEPSKNPGETPLPEIWVDGDSFLWD